MPQKPRLSSPRILLVLSTGCWVLADINPCKCFFPRDSLTTLCRLHPQRYGFGRFYLYSTGCKFRGRELGFFHTSTLRTFRPLFVCHPFGCSVRTPPDSCAPQVLERLPQTIADFPGGVKGCEDIFEPEVAGIVRDRRFLGPLRLALQERQFSETLCISPLVYEYMSHRCVCLLFCTSPRRARCMAGISCVGLNMCCALLQITGARQLLVVHLLSLFVR